jgi:hypothetical protein
MMFPTVGTGVTGEIVQTLRESSLDFSLGVALPFHLPADKVAAGLEGHDGARGQRGSATNLTRRERFDLAAYPFQRAEDLDPVVVAYDDRAAVTVTTDCFAAAA